jgi:predicted ATPase
MQRAHYQQLALAPLSVEAIGELIADLIGTHPTTRSLARRIHEHTGGNPFFAEEVVQTLIESGQLEGTRRAYRLRETGTRLEVPPTVQALLAARIDRLPEREKRVLQSAAVIGKDFAEPLLAAVAGLPERELAEAVARLRSSEFLHERSLYPSASPMFAMKTVARRARRFLGARDTHGIRQRRIRPRTRDAASPALATP